MEISRAPLLILMVQLVSSLMILGNKIIVLAVVISVN